MDVVVVAQGRVAVAGVGGVPVGVPWPRVQMRPLKITYLTSRAQALPAAQLAIRHPREQLDQVITSRVAVGVVAARHRPGPPAADGVDVEGPTTSPYRRLAVGVR